MGVVSSSPGGAGTGAAGGGCAEDEAARRAVRASAGAVWGDLRRVARFCARRRMHVSPVARRRCRS